ncbi:MULTISPECIES: isoprenyl transferase [Stappiaceae]|uniref:isoprenyl transferase n=1 Tax=Stappiaceae TaxID=2821832 RepID=UPI001ADD06F3|nr:MULTISPECIES: isoprenyl transferase [Stappiaceae]MBO9418942.1 isoprenyl transferase [Labrenzia sp. R4_2]
MSSNLERQANAEPVSAAPSHVPNHVAFIMDGNGRWASSRGLPRTEGHRQGLEALRKIIRHAALRGVGIVTIYSFSTENWSRPEPEVRFLMGLLRRFVQRDLSELHRENIRIRIIGERDNLDAGILKLLLDAEELTRNNTGMELVVAFNYGARQELTAAVKKLCEKVARGEIEPSAITEAHISAELDTAGLPDPDLIVRTSGELRLSNFLLWQAAYTEFYFSDLMWPDFDEAALDQALECFGNRDRRYGGVTAQAL